ncbi:Monooxygenase FAD-binding [Penicillium mononematosum]|uniref:Monooxygenase FAD-binding n=1 Tax=Penicillium mononematosum TaxID=268346 RepID=UPI002549A550|nr:Monooxygenase FAD-binding [Penicillium mononematosum]KAJ6190001.1 Monooxygenase FAD-binding [Penicillium mononematosum]
MASSLPHAHGDHAPFDVAVVGGGIVGLHVALGLVRRGIPVTIYEQAHELKEIGAGMGFTSNIVGCMAAIDPKVAESLDDVSIRSGGSVRWIDGLAQEDLRSRPENRLFDVEICLDGEAIARTTHRGQFLNELVKLLPPNQIKLGKRLDTIAQTGENEKLLLKFCDATTAEADAEEDDPAAIPHYAHESAYRCLVDMDKALPVMGDLCKTMVMYMGQGAHIMAYPVDNFKSLNVAAFVHDDGEWPQGEKHTVLGSKEDIQKAYSGFGPTVRSLVALLPDELNRWAMFDTFDHPLTTYAYGRITLAGDAAHGSTPHYGSGAGMGVEDALVLSTVLEQAATKLKTHGVAVSKARALTAAFEAYDAVRRERSQWLVRCSRRQGQKVKGLDREIGKDFDKFKEHTKAFMDKLVYYDFKAMLQQATDEFESRVSGSIPL